MSAESERLKFRESLKKFSDGEINARELAEIHPNCEYQLATSVLGGCGPVTNNETLRLFVASSHIKIRKSYDFSSESLRTCMVNKNSYSRVLTVGVSICKIDFASEDEENVWVNEIYNSLIRNHPNSGGIYGSIDISAGEIRDHSLAIGSFCIHETPLGIKENGNYLQPSHADIVWSNSKLDSVEDEVVIRDQLYNVMKNKGKITPWSNTLEYKFSKYLPRVTS